MRKKRDWLFVEYKRNNPGQFKEMKKKSSANRLWRRLTYIVIFIAANIIALLLSALLNEDIRIWILQIIL